ncbi:hypothetical protein Ngar_c06560 [Candidatus Nitrososphaera gargensis Ga9.2]|uniref:Uncharacterized protein n=1 Tax=Nitrososphaera gargensis (strain Ga9.2) TaxID=1237085 RepID=K0IM65_NITGG|nr:hypothetical protein [Candidatus Nitrososphaera gargensis]AFU57599.1 hypothetical protein Ngar_c06560 [Candidatus Nitrososphaera gargensis Ga9.2]
MNFKIVVEFDTDNIGTKEKSAYDFYDGIDNYEIVSRIVDEPKAQVGDRIRVGNVYDFQHLPWHKGDMGIMYDIETTEDGLRKLWVGKMGQRQRPILS